jgi:hypothetical protein
MKNRGRSFYYGLMGFVLFFASILLAQTPPDRILFVNGKAAGTVTQIGGRAYVDIDTVAQFVNGNVTLEANRILLTFPGAGPGAGPGPGPGPGGGPPLPPQALSKDFARLAIGELAEMREWRGAVGTILTYGVPVVGSWPQDYRDHAEADLNQVAVATVTAADQDALQLLRNEFNNLTQWASDVVSARQSLNATKSVNPDLMKSDPTLAKVTACSQFLSSMLVSGAFADDPSCH